MTVLDIGILLLLVLWAAGAVRHMRRHGSCGCGECGKCGGDCGRCSGGEK